MISKHHLSNLLIQKDKIMFIYDLINSDPLLFLSFEIKQLKTLLIQFSNKTESINCTLRNTKMTQLNSNT